MTTKVPVGQFPHYYALVDSEDYDLVSQFKWKIMDDPKKNTVYATHRLPDGSSIFMHKLITGFSQTDHANGIGLDNRRENLRETDTSTNKANGVKYKINKFGDKPSSPYKGVTWNKKASRWYAQIKFQGKQTYLGSFVSEIEAAKAYDKAAIELFGEFSRINFPNGELP